MQSWSSKDFTADRAWGALDIANFSGTTVRLHWTDQSKRRRYLLRRGGMRACRSPAGGGAYSGD